MKKKCLINAFSVLVLLAPKLWGQNPDELLVIRLPAKHGHINEPGATPIPFPTVRGQIAVPGHGSKVQEHGEWPLSVVR
jgi:hypothetical protein